jgi:peroxiredoxin
MSRIELNQPAPDFVLEDFRNQPIRLSDYFHHKNTLLVFNRGFI